MHFYILTLFPEMVRDALGHSMTKRAVDKGLIRITCIDIRDFAGNKHRRVDDAPYGGGAGMVMQPQPVYDACLYAKSLANNDDIRVIYMSPQGRTFTQPIAREMAKAQSVILLCGHYEGIDDRVLQAIVTDEISIGDYVLTGGELAAAVIVDAVSRLIPGVLGKPASYADESFENGLLEYPQYTRPPVFLGQPVPDVLLSGHHAHVAAWRMSQAIERTKAKRPDLLRG